MVRTSQQLLPVDSGRPTSPMRATILCSRMRKGQASIIVTWAARLHTHMMAQHHLCLNRLQKQGT